MISDAYFNHSLAYDNPSLTFVSFDFHEYCRGMHFENISILVAALEERMRAMRYCWMDAHGVVCEQEGVFRVNCIDCLDRTNVVQTAIAKWVLENQGANSIAWKSFGTFIWVAFLGNFGLFLLYVGR